MRRPAIAATWLLVVGALGSPTGLTDTSTTSSCGQLHEGTADVPGLNQAWTYRVWVPSPCDGPRELVVALHGSLQTYESLRTASRLETLSNSTGFIVLYPEHPEQMRSRPDDGNLVGARAWRWWMIEQQQRTGYEARFIWNAINETDDLPGIEINRSRVSVIGFSAGGAMAAVLGAIYPDVFQAAGVVAGIGYGAAQCTNDDEVCYTTELVPAMAGLGRNPQTNAGLAYDRIPASVRPTKAPAVIMHGDLDLLADPSNMPLTREMVVQLNDLLDDGSDNGSVDDTSDAHEDKNCPDGLISHWSHLDNYVRNAGPLRVETMDVDDMDHQWPGNTYTWAPNGSVLFLNFTTHVRSDGGARLPAAPQCGPVN